MIRRPVRNLVEILSEGPVAVEVLDDPPSGDRVPSAVVTDLKVDPAHAIIELAGDRLVLSSREALCLRSIHGIAVADSRAGRTRLGVECLWIEIERPGVLGPGEGEV